jgi:hypothetical protein
MILFQLFVAGIFVTGGKFATGINDTSSGKFGPSAVGTGGKLPPV